MKPEGWRLISNRPEEPWRAAPMVLALAVLGTVVGAVWLQSLASVRGYHLFRAGSPYHVPAIIGLLVLFLLLGAASFPRIGGFCVAFVYFTVAAVWASAVEPLVTAALLVMGAGYAAFSLIRITRR
jgi:hypothetical protein